MKTSREQDEVDRIVESWSRERPDLDVTPMLILSRVDRLSRHLDRARRDAFAQSDLEPWEWDVLSALKRAGPPYRLSPKRLLKQTLVSSGTMTNRIDRLATRGLVNRSRNPDDRRGVAVTLSPAGQQRIDAAVEHLMAAEATLLSSLSASDQHALAALLRQLSLPFEVASEDVPQTVASRR